MEKCIQVEGAGSDNRSLTVLLATGIDVNGFKIVPVIIDPDQADGDVTRTIEILKVMTELENSLMLLNSKPYGNFSTQKSVIK
jgi:hypothetical protein